MEIIKTLLENESLFYGLTGGILIILSLAAGYMFGQRSRKGKTREKKDDRSFEGSLDDRWKKIYQLSTDLSNTLNYEKLLDTALDLSAAVLTQGNGSSGLLVSAVLLFDQDELIVHTARRFTNADLRNTFPGAKGLLGEAINKGEATGSQDILQDPEISRVVAIRSCKSAYCIPLRSGLDVYGVLLFAHPEKEFFNQDNCEVLEIMAVQAMNSIQNARLYQDLAQEKERLAETQEETRRKLARDLHDGPTQSIAAIAMRINFARRLIERNPKEASEELFKIEDLARKTTKEIRHMLFTLRPLVLESKGLRAALEAMAEKMQETFGQEVLIEVDDNIVAQLDMGKQGVIFNIADEAVNNARKHAQAAHIWVRLKASQKGLALLEIRDDGVGFDVEKTKSTYENRGSLGMINLKERSELLNGVLHLQSKPGVGTRVQVYIPMTEEAIELLLHRS
ncbi:MAG TPA: GAF domain-containing sensor histidine kinase [Anaerolineales bacterium]|nr:GAF domain-containing sensor histidine kinase [Anaerolineales bacterium]